MPLLLTNSASKLFGMATAGYYSSSDESCLFGAEYLKKVMIQIALNQQRMIIPTTIVTVPTHYGIYMSPVNKRMSHGVMQVHNLAHMYCNIHAMHFKM